MRICFHTNTVKCENCMTEDYKMSGSFRYTTNVTAQPHNADKNPSSTTPTEQDKELWDLLITLFESGKELSDMYSKYDGDKDWSDWLSDILPKTDLYQLITADRKRVALEARIDELKKIEIGGDKIWTVDSGTDTAMLIEERIAELKQELKR